MSEEWCLFSLLYVPFLLPFLLFSHRLAVLEVLRAPLFLPKNGENSVRNVQKDTTVRLVQEYQESGETPVKPVGKRERMLPVLSRNEEKVVNIPHIPELKPQ